jgi:hypothetical protein
MSVTLSRFLLSILFVGTLSLAIAGGEAAGGDSARSDPPVIAGPAQARDGNGIDLDPNDVAIPEDEANSHPGGKGRTGAGMGVGYPGYRGQGGDDAPHHRQYGTPPRADDE